jgi:hypothetical protein
MTDSLISVHAVPVGFTRRCDVNVWQHEQRLVPPKRTVNRLDQLWACGLCAGFFFLGPWPFNIFTSKDTGSCLGG